MMSDPLDQFEQHLRRQPVRQIPAGWRAEILAAARAAQAPQTGTASRAGSRVPWYSLIGREILFSAWPNPKAWAGMAAVWVLIVALNFSMRDASPAPAGAEKSAPATPDRVAELRQQQRMFAELAGLNAMPDADRPKNPALQPRSQRTGWAAI